MKIVNELPKAKRNNTGESRRVREIRAFAKSGAKYGLLEYMTNKSASMDTVRYKNALSKYKADGGVGEFQIRTINKKCYIIRLTDES